MFRAEAISPRQVCVCDPCVWTGGTSVRKSTRAYKSRLTVRRIIIICIVPVGRNAKIKNNEPGAAAAAALVCERDVREKKTASFRVSAANARHRLAKSSDTVINSANGNNIRAVSRRVKMCSFLFCFSSRIYTVYTHVE